MTSISGPHHNLHDIGKLNGYCIQALKCHLPEVNTIRDRFKDS